jgi:ribosomal protein L14E/L6E/L27E
MPNPIIKIVNATTGEEIEREMTSQEFARWNAEVTKNLERKELESQAQAAKAAAEAKLAALGLTTEDLKALGL